MYEIVRAMGQKNLTWVLLGLLASLSASSATEVAYSEHPIEVDGILSETVWLQQTAASDFHQVEPVEFDQPSETTTVMFALDDSALYIAMRAEQTAASIRDRQLVQGASITGDDELTVLLDPFGHGRQGYAFSVNPNGVRNEAIIENADDFNEDWEDIWQAKTQRLADAWVAEIRIPFKSLTFPAGRDQWQVNVQRRIAARNEVIAWASADRRVDLTTTRAVTGFSQVKPGAGFDLVLGAALKREKDFDEGTDKTRLEPSLDLFYKWTPSLTAALTINTDFSAAEVDNREVNLSRFDLFFPEKRAFFLQDANVFEFGGIEENGRPYFSRKIGLSDEGEPLDLRVGARLSGRHGNYSIGALVVQQDAEIDLEPTNVLVARVQAEVSEESALGGILTYGNPISDQDDQLFGIDYRYLNDDVVDDQELEAYAWWQQFSPQQGADDDAWGATIAWPNDTIDAAVSVLDIGTDFAPPLGFVNRAGIQDWRAEMTYRWRPENAYLRTIDSGFDANWVLDHAGKLESKQIELAPVGLGFQSGDMVELKFVDRYERLSEPFEVVDEIEIEPGRYHFERNEIEFESADHRVWRGSLNYSWGSFFDGDLKAIEASTTVTPSRHLALGLDYEENRLDLPAGKATVRLYRTVATVAFNEQWSWSTLAQYDSESREFGINTRLRWLPEAGREGLIVVNHGSFRDQFDRFQSTESEMVLKFSYTFQF